MVSAVVESGETSVSDLAKRFAVSQATVRRDLELLEQQRLVTRVHGGATVHVDFNDIPLGYKAGTDFSEKRRIAERALMYVERARVIGLTGGTTVRELSKLLLDREGLTVVTNALNIATDIAANSKLRVFAAGGEMRSSSQETVGRHAEAFLSEYNIDVVFLGVDGVDAEAGCTNYDPAGASVNSALRKRGQLVVVLADATKISHVALARLCGMEDVDVLITDTRAPEPALEAIRARGCTVVCV